ncbi:hypothetical protein MGN70_003050 [Eutypa lata]|nr:hypothetical protein MGN70_003050 [Eutypa lata]
MAFFSHESSQNMTPQGPIQQLRLLWPDGTGERDDQSSTADQECDDSDNIFPAPECQSCGKRGTPVRPQVIVNVLSTGGSSMGGSGSSAGGSGGSGSGEGGSGIGGNINIPGGGGVGAVGHVTPVPLLEAQVVELLRKVEHLSAQRAARELVVETGTWNTMDVRPWQKPEQSTKGRITFLRKFRFPPAVTTSICSLDASRSQNLRIKVYATDISSKGFTIYASSWYDTQIYSCGVSWSAIGE